MKKTFFGNIGLQSLKCVLLGALIAMQMAMTPPAPTQAQIEPAALTTIALWTFDSSTTSPAIGAGTITLIGDVTATFATGASNASPDQAWNTTSYPADSTGDKTAGIRINASTAGFNNIRLSFAQRNSAVAANTTVVQYSTDGINFADAATFNTTIATAWYTRSVDFTGVPAMNNAPNAAFRIVTSFLTGTNAYSGTTPGGNYAINGTIRFDNVTIASFTALPSTCGLPFTRIYDVQGSTDTSALSGTVQSVQGVVVGDYEGASPNLRGFYLQDAAGDGNPVTSDGIFVFNSSNNSVTLGSLISVTGQVQEFQGQTQMGSMSGLEVCSAGASVTPTDVTLPFASADFPERYEGMLVRFPQTLHVTEHFQLDRFGQIVASANDRLRQPTQVAVPGAPALAVQLQNNLNQIIVDDALNNQNPDPILFGRNGNPLSAANTLRGGDTFSNAVGVLTYNWAGNSASPNAYRLRPVNALGGGMPNFAASNPRSLISQPVSGTLRVASINLLNFFNTFTNCTLGVGGATTDCRGAENQAEFDRQLPKTIANVIGTGADVIGIVEMENDGYGPDSAIQMLVNALNNASAPNTFAFLDVDARTSQVNALGNDAIKVGFIYKLANVTPVSNTAVLNTGAFGQFNTGAGALQRNRPALAQAFQQIATSEVIVVSINHLKSKGSGCSDNVSPVGPDPDAGDGQGNCNQTRKAAAQQLAAWLATNPTGSTDPDVLIMGDMNSYTKEDPITALVNAGFTNLIEGKIGADAYSYAFDGQWGYLDHALASSSLVTKVAEAIEWHINADEPAVLDYNTNFKSAGQQSSLYAPDAFRSSDHDPVIVGIRAQAPPKVNVHLPVVMR